MKPLMKAFKDWMTPSLPQESDFESSVLTPGTIPVNGTVTLMNNQLYVTYPDAHGSYARLFVPDDDRVTVLVNGERTVGEVILTPSVHVHFRFLEKKPVRRLESYVSEDGLKLILKKIIVAGKRCWLENQSEKSFLALKIIEEAIMPGEMKEQELNAFLATCEFIGEIDEEAYQQALHASMTTEVVLVNGKPPITGNEPCFKTEFTASDRCPFSNQPRYPHVTKGTIVGWYEKGTPSVSGMDVKGNKIEVKRSPLPALGSGVMLRNGQLIATCEGELIFTSTLIDVQPELYFDGDVPANSENIVFDGNILVKGSVLRQNHITCTGHVYIGGSVLESTISAKKGVSIHHSLVYSTVSCREEGFVCDAVREQTTELRRLLQDLDTNYPYFVKLTIDAFKNQTSHTCRELFANVYQAFSTLFQCKEKELFAKNEALHVIFQAYQTDWVQTTYELLPQIKIKQMIQAVDAFLASIPTYSPADGTGVFCQHVVSSSVVSYGTVHVTKSVVKSGVKAHSISVLERARQAKMVAQHDVRIASATETEILHPNPRPHVTILRQLEKVHIKTKE